jgi:thymidylate synthase
VSEAWARLAETLQGATEEDSRAGPVLVVPEPVTTVYERSRERVLFCPTRDANPFFHLIEALWMLAGRADARTLNRYVSDFGQRFAEPDGTIHGAYGHRWRHALGLDQLDAVVTKLQLNPGDRQAVIQMWNAVPEGLYGSNDLVAFWRDRPCNTHCYVRVRREERLTHNGGVIRDGAGGQMDYVEPEVQSFPVLDLTVLCRSNDAIWGAYGANAVHFSVLQEYLAARLGAEVGLMYQVSNNFHVYQDVWEAKRPSDEQVNAAESVSLGCMPMFSAPRWIDHDVQMFFDWHDSLWGGGVEGRPTYHNEWFARTAQRVARAWFSYRAQRTLDAALSMARAVGCPAWRTACVEWLMRRGAE